MKVRYKKDETYNYDYVKIIKYNKNHYKAIQFKYRVKQAGFEKEKRDLNLKVDIESLIEKSPISIEHLMQSISRTKKTVYEYALCNDFDFFITLTFDRKKYDSSDLKELKRIVGQWLSNYKKRINPNIKYLIIPELHKDNKHFHFHGLISNINDITEFKKSRKGIMRYNWTPWHDKFGFTSLEEIRDKDAVSKYITKYITKDVIQTFNKHRYLCSKGLKKPKTIFEITHYIEEMPCDFENDFVRIKNLNSYEEFYNELMKIGEHIEDTGGMSMWN